MATYIKIATVTVGAGGQAAMEFTSIPSTYTDLQVLISARGTSNANYGNQLLFKANSTSSNYSYRVLEGQDSSVYSGNNSAQASLYVGRIPSPLQTASTFCNNQIYIPNYAGSTNKSISTESVVEKNAATDWIDQMFAGLWSNTAAISTISLTLDVGSFAQYSTATLYGIKKS